MKGLNGREISGRHIKTLFVLSVIVPVSLMTAFKLTIFQKEPPAVLTITLDAVTLNLSRPSETVGIGEPVQNEWTQDRLHILAGVFVYDYREGSADPPFYTCDGFVFKTYVNASSEQGHIDTVKIRLRLFDEDAAVLVSQERWALRLNNATLTDLHYFGTKEIDAYINATSMKPSCQISDTIYWVLLDEHTENHRALITTEVTFTNQTLSETITIPVELGIIPS